VATGLLATLPRGLDAVPESGVSKYRVRDLWGKPLVLDMMLARRLSYERCGSQVGDVADTLTLA
jgi:hypothetical protein